MRRQNRKVIEKVLKKGRWYAILDQSFKGGMMNTYKADIPCECGEYDIEITSGFVGYMGDNPCSEDYGECSKCKKQLSQHQINKRFEDPH